MHMHVKTGPAELLVVVRGRSEQPQSLPEPQGIPTANGSQWLSLRDTRGPWTELRWISRGSLVVEKSSLAVPHHRPLTLVLALTDTLAL